MVSTMYEHVRQMETAYADRIAIRYFDEEKQAVREITYREFTQDIRRFVAHLRRSVPRLKGAHVSILAHNCYHYVVAIFGTIASGAVLVPLNIANGLDEIRYELEFAEVDCLFHDGSYLEREPGLAEFYKGTLLELDAFASCGELAELEPCEDVDALAFLMFTSGTTSRPKGVMLSQRNLFAPMDFWISFDELAEQRGLPKGYRFALLNVLPMYHIACFTSLNSWSISGNTNNLCLNMKNFYRDLQVMKSDAVQIVPVILKSIHRDVMKGRREKLGQLWMLMCSAARSDIYMMEDLIKAGYYIMQLYGLTEACGDGAMNMSQDLRHVTSVGKCDYNCEYKLENGELCMRGGPVMLGYYKAPEATAEVIQDGWLHTGDLARFDSEGYLYITGRKKNLIILSSGENVSPEELEELLDQNEDVQEVIVKEKGDRICAVICCAEDRQASVRAFVTEMNRTLPLYKRVTAVEFSDGPLPRNATGKLLRG